MGLLEPDGRLLEDIERFEDPPAKGRLAERVPSGKRPCKVETAPWIKIQKKYFFNSLVPEHSFLDFQISSFLKMAEFFRHL
jgi:hypothetical protein